MRVAFQPAPGFFSGPEGFSPRLTAILPFKVGL